jgi:hypothetical protein
MHFNFYEVLYSKLSHIHDSATIAAIFSGRNTLVKKLWIKYVGNSISKLQIKVATYVFELSAGNYHH